MSLVLYDYWRSTAAYRVRIALNLKGLVYQSKPVHLARGEHRAEAYTRENPQGLVPMLVDDGVKLTQSLAIIEYLDEEHPNPPLLPLDSVSRAQVRAMAHIIASDLHPINNLRVQQFLTGEMGVAEEKKTAWIHHWMHTAFASLEAAVKAAGSEGRYCFGEAPSLADLCLIPQCYNARRFEVDMSRYPTLVAIDRHCTSLPAFQAAQPENQKDAA